MNGCDGKPIKPMSLVKASISPKYKNVYPKPIRNGETMLFLGEINQAQGHCAVADKKGKIYWMYHTNNFRMLEEDEI